MNGGGHSLLGTLKTNSNYKTLKKYEMKILSFILEMFKRYKDQLHTLQSQIKFKSL